jgi:hypothetical protein
MAGTLELRTALPSEVQALTELALRSKRAWRYDERFMELVTPHMVVHPEYLMVEHGVVAEESGVTVGCAIARVDGEYAFLRDCLSSQRDCCAVSANRSSGKQFIMHQRLVRKSLPLAAIRIPSDSTNKWACER